MKIIKLNGKWEICESGDTLYKYDILKKALGHLGISNKEQSKFWDSLAKNSGKKITPKCTFSWNHIQNAINQVNEISGNKTMKLLVILRSLI